MALNESLVYAIPAELIGKAGGLLLVLQALGWAIIFYIMFSILNFFMNRRKNKELRQMNENLEDIKHLLMARPIRGTARGSRTK